MTPCAFHDCSLSIYRTHHFVNKVQKIHWNVCQRFGSSNINIKYSQHMSLCSQSHLDAHLNNVFTYFMRGCENIAHLNTFKQLRNITNSNYNDIKLKWNISQITIKIQSRKWLQNVFLIKNAAKFDGIPELNLISISCACKPDHDTSQLKLTAVDYFRISGSNLWTLNGFESFFVRSCIYDESCEL